MSQGAIKRDIKGKAYKLVVWNGKKVENKIFWIRLDVEGME